MFEVMLGGRTANKSMFIREVSSAEFITGDALASSIGLTTGVAQYPTTGWLHFEDDGKTKYVSKRPLRHTISWDQIHAVGAVWGTVTVEIAGATYKVRLFSGSNTEPSTTPNGTFDHPGTWDCEWNRLMYHISAKPFGHGSTTLQSEGITEGDWDSYSEADLLTHYTYGNGSYSWCQETASDGATRRVGRGYVGVSTTNTNPSSLTHILYGWRPVLELIE